MRTVNILDLEIELKQRLELPYVWGRKQSDDWDSATNFIYSTETFRELQKEVLTLPQDMKDYAYTRWYNFWSAMGVEAIFAEHESVTPQLNEKHKLIDFSISGVSFDHKTTVFPKGFPFDYEYAKENPKRLIAWLYENQSRGGRNHKGSRLFVVLKSKGENWKMKADLTLIKGAVDKYMESFSKDNLVVLKYPNNTVYSDIIWVEE